VGGGEGSPGARFFGLYTCCLAFAPSLTLPGRCADGVRWFPMCEQPHEVPVEPGLSTDQVEPGNLPPGECVIRSKRGFPLRRRFGSLCTSLRQQLAARTAILDGEVVAVDEAARPRFTDVLGSGARLAYAAFDLLWLDSRELRPPSLARRRAKLATVLPCESRDVFKAFVEEGQGVALLEVVQRLVPRGDRCEAHAGSIHAARDLVQDQESELLAGGGTRRSVQPPRRR
jgi:hypothetical protein